MVEWDVRRIGREMHEEDKPADWAIKQLVLLNPGVHTRSIVKIIDELPHPWGIFLIERAIRSDVPNHYANHTNYRRRQAAASSDMIHQDWLFKLAKDGDGMVRWAVASNPKTAEPTLRMLSKDLSEIVQNAVAVNARTTEPILSELCMVRSTVVARHAKINLLNRRHIASGEIRKVSRNYALEA